MKKLKKVGFFKELSHGDDNGESLIALVNRGILADSLKVAGYLNNGHFLMIAPTVVTDVLSDEQKFIGTLTIQTDGVWAWPSDLAYYVSNYGVLLPPDFIQYMSDNKWVISSVDVSNLTL
ncbi:hypothetical protein I2494_13815 [Budviciaceae bacterium BWR-B9]|uniref:Uncharacterized protein n=1 Tax=Limnobaculum allomyrinae TaxID=2791986 RepID=A0ABS1IU31_9GAMM|nr:MULTISPECIES: hypothetical protein [Limnobaculum]MBK5144775.1 hypothetical protein [Limnobaculum allomyrinae]MBV7692438.1 hypothetical protein [Limnobaculum sp. M2-1]